MVFVINSRLQCSCRKRTVAHAVPTLVCWCNKGFILTDNWRAVCVCVKLIDSDKNLGLKDDFLKQPPSINFSYEPPLGFTDRLDTCFLNNDHLFVDAEKMMYTRCTIPKRLTHQDMF